MNWSSSRANELNEKLSRLKDKGGIRYTFVPSERAQSAFQNGYFPEPTLLDAELSAFAPHPFEYIPFDPAAKVDIVLTSVHGGENEPEKLWELRQQVGDETLIVSWLWDNHVSHIANVKTSLASDVVFASHDYEAGYLHTPVTPVGPHIPLCCAQWTTKQAAEFFDESLSRPRCHKLLINYLVQAPASQLRTRVLEAYRDGLEEADVFVMTKAERARYFELSRRERFLDWASYKATVIVPMGRDLSTRVFDALLTGQIIIVPDIIDDFDTVIPPIEHERLGIVHTPSLELADVREAARKALALFDTMGEDGTRARHRYALEHHMLVNRVEQMLYALWLLIDGQFSVEAAQAHYGMALYLRRTGIRGSDNGRRTAYSESASENQTALRLHIGGWQRRDGWQIMGVSSRPEIDIIGNIKDLSSFADDSVTEIYASHVLEHIPHRELLDVLKGIQRVLVPSGRFYVAVPDLAVLCSLFTAPERTMEEKAKIMATMFGAQADPHDFHYTGFDFDMMALYLSHAGFSSLEQVESFGLFDDTSEARLFGHRISLNLVAVK
ncbi:class I SAM-dependent methyltransferase [Azospira restricta]|uniref:Methyltransferase domain-containing protein n=1 Tax=Azospira restricta TaxID=404405 RepID=A0A974PYN9_9RHOO|nr:methyltransferase domain-containing protein [Azospira restricta]QRJ63604.1 methyltransferase domain-containing protein [Azospira restricta]